MYENAEEVIARILTIVAKCPDNLKEKCFEVLLRGYVETEISIPARRTANETSVLTEREDTSIEAAIPEAVRQRFKSTAKRLSVSLPKLAGLFDFGNDPFTFHALVVPGMNNADKTRKVALLVAAKTYLATGNWIADWQEVKAECINQNCYVSTNQSVNLQAGEGKVWFKSVEVGKNIELSAEGQKEAQKLLTLIAQAE